MTDYAFDPELAAAIPMLPAFDWDDIEVARAARIEMTKMAASGPERDDIEWEDHQIPGAPGDPDVTVRVFRPLNLPGTLPAVLSIHGGGFCMGTIDMDHPAASAYAALVPAVVVSVEYRLAPEHPYPAAVEDCYASLVWMAGAADVLGIDPARIAVMGASAGGGLAAAVALLARDRGGPALCYQVLGIPELDDRLETESMKQFVDTPVWSRPRAELSWRYYLGDLDGEVPPYAAPARAADLSGLPPAFVNTMEFDPLRDEGITYALRLLAAGVSVELHQYPGTFHGSALVATAAVSKRAASDQLAAVRRKLAPPA
jgi:acetyl esterase